MRFAGGMIGSEAGREMDLYEITSAISDRTAGERADRLQTLTYTKSTLMLWNKKIKKRCVAAQWQKVDKAIFGKLDETCLDTFIYIYVHLHLL